MNQERQTHTMQKENFKKILHTYGKSNILIARQHFSMVLLWRQFHRVFLRFDNLTRPSGRHGNFTRLCNASTRHALLSIDLCALSTAESLSCPKRVGSIGRPTIFQGQQYSRCSKAGGCRAALLLGGFRCRRGNLLIVSRATPTQECTLVLTIVREYS
jgi:hypothetical protein